MEVLVVTGAPQVVQRLAARLAERTGTSHGRLLAPASEQVVDADEDGEDEGTAEDDPESASESPDNEPMGDDGVGENEPSF